MNPDGRRQLEINLDDDYSCEKCCSDLPYNLWNTCPLCVCGLMPIFVVCFSAAFRLDYATHVTDIGAKIINEIGLSYTIYYTAGCWPDLNAEAGQPPSDGSLRLRSHRCNNEQFEIAAGEFDALSGSLLTVRNVTKLHARRVEAVKVSPDWRYIVFVGALANDIGNLYAVGAEEVDAQQAVPLLHEKQLDALDAQCQLHSRGILAAADAPPAKGQQVARLAGYKHLQVIIPGVDPQDESASQQMSPGSSPQYRAAFAFECAEPGGPLNVPMRGPGVHPLRFSKLALLDFQLLGLNITSRGGPPGPNAHSRSELRILDAVPVSPPAAGAEVRKAVSRYLSQACPRFVPSKQGSELLFVAEDLVSTRQAPTPAPSAWVPSSALPSRRLGIVEIPSAAWESAAAEPPAARALAEEAEAVDGAAAAADPTTRRLQRLATGCCRAATAECFACTQGMTTKEFCEKPINVRIIGCESTTSSSPAQGSMECCGELTAECLACREGISKEAFCQSPARRGVVGCPLPVPTCCQEHTAKCQACLQGKSVPQYCEESGTHAGVPGCEQSTEDLSGGRTPQAEHFSFMAMKVDAMLLNVGFGALPFAPVQGCPEFVPTFYYSSQNLADTVRDNLFNRAATEAEAELAERKFRDTFVIISDPTSASVLGVDAQVLAVSLPEGAPTGAVSRVHLLYNVGNAPGTFAHRAGGGSERLRLGGCGPIRAAGRQGHMKLQSVVETLMATLNLPNDKTGYTAWLACLTADQRIAIVESPNRERWINMSMPYPMWTGRPTQAVWCPEEREEACFEVWSNPNPNE